MSVRDLGWRRAGSEKPERKGPGPQGFSSEVGSAKGFSSEVGSARLEVSLPGWSSPFSITVKLMSPESLLAGQDNCCGPRET